MMYHCVVDNVAAQTFLEPLLSRIMRIDMQSHTKECKLKLLDQLRQITIERLVYIRRSFSQVLETLQHSPMIMTQVISFFELEDLSLSNLNFETFSLNLDHTNTVQSPSPYMDFVNVSDVFGDILEMDFTTPHPVENPSGVASQEKSAIASPVPSSSSPMLSQFSAIDHEPDTSPRHGSPAAANQEGSVVASPAPSSSSPMSSEVPKLDHEPDTSPRHGSPAAASQEGSVVASLAPSSSSLMSSEVSRLDHEPDTSPRHGSPAAASQEGFVVASPTPSSSSPMSFGSPGLDHEPDTSHRHRPDTQLCEYARCLPFSKDGQQTSNSQRSCYDVFLEASPQDPRELSLEAIKSIPEAQSPKASTSVDENRESGNELHSRGSPTPSSQEDSGPEVASKTRSSPEAAPQTLPMPISVKALKSSISDPGEGDMHTEAMSHSDSSAAEFESKEVLAVVEGIPTVSLKNVDLDLSAKSDQRSEPDSTRTRKSTSKPRLSGAVNNKSIKRLVNNTQQESKGESICKRGLERFLIYTVLSIVIVFDGEDEGEEGCTRSHRRKRRRLEKGLNENNILSAKKSSFERLTRTNGKAKAKQEYNKN